MEFEMAPRDYPNISCGILTKQSFKDWGTVRELFTLWHKVAPAYFPNRYDVIEPIRRPLSIETLDAMQEIWEMSVCFKTTKSPWVEASCSIEGSFESERKYSTLHVTAESGTSAEPELIKFIEQAALATDAEFAYMHRANSTEQNRDREKKIDSVYTCGVADKYPLISVYSKHLPLGMPDLYWCTILGKDKVEEIGRARLSACPVYKVQWLNDDLVRLQLTSSINDSRDNEQDFEKLRANIKRYLGEKLFQPYSWPDGYRPIIDILNELSAKNFKK